MIPMTHTPTAEQAHTLALFKTGRNLTITALAGSGKTTTLKMLANASDQRMLYTSFGANVVRDAKASFPKNVRASTNHGLAWGSVGRLYADAKRLPPESRLTPRVLQQHFDWRPAAFGGLDANDGSRLVMETLTRFCQSADPSLTSDHVPPPETVGTAGALALAGAAHGILTCARKVWAECENPHSSLPITHDTYLKLWALSDPKLAYDVCLLDEAQDTNPLMVGVLLNQTHAQRIIVGDPFQQIYSWRGAVNAMTQFDCDHTAHLTQSFRFGDAIADAANAVLGGHLESHTRVRGDPNHASRLEVIAHPRVILSRTNASLISEIVTALEQRNSPRIAVVGGVDDLIRLVEGAHALERRERPTKCPELAEFAEWDEVRAYSKLTVGKDLQVLVRLVDAYGTHGLRRTLDRVRGHERDEDAADLILSTVHKAKGREWPQIKLGDDFKAPPPKHATPEERLAADWNPEEANLLYVALTRARDVLDVSTCSAWRDAADRFAQSQGAPGNRATVSPLAMERTAQPLSDVNIPQALNAHARTIVGAWLDLYAPSTFKDAAVALLNEAYPEARPAAHARAGLR